jgi:putative polyketide hydroxylase
MIGGDHDLADSDGAWRNLYELDEDGAVLVRPDGYVCWRSRSGAAVPEAVLSAALDRVLGRG